MNHPIIRAGPIGALLLALAAPASAQSQVVYSVDWHGPTMGLPDAGGGFPITPMDVLTPLGNMAAPGLPPPAVIWISGGIGPPAPGLAIPTHGACFGAPPCTLCPTELDALSNGQDRLLQMNEPPGSIWFSVDEYASGVLSPPVPPCVLTEGALGPAEAPADVYADLGLGAGPIAPGPVIGHVMTIDGDGIPTASPFTAPGISLIEPNPPTFAPCNPGDNLDALGFAAPGGTFTFPVYYSLDHGAPTPFGYANTGTAPANGFSGADVLASPVAGAPPFPFAPAPAMGLDSFGFDTDDIDALILAENGDGQFQPSQVPYDWLGGGTDMLLFSLRDSSMTILAGVPDSIFGLPIEPGDILTTPLAGGVSPWPGIFYPAESLGLATVRSGIPNPITNFGDELDALASPRGLVFDCNSNGIEDFDDILSGSSSDVNTNGIPDDCELLATPYCFGVGCPCGNNDPSAGCMNSTGVGALMTATGTTSITLDDLVLTTTSVVPNKFGVYFMGPLAGNLPFGDGLRCVLAQPPPGLGVRRYNPPTNSGPAGVLTVGPGIATFACTTFPPAYCPTVGATWLFQCWYRDPIGPCPPPPPGFNTSNAMAVLFGL